MKSSCLFLILLGLSLALSIEVAFDKDRYIMAIYSNGTVQSFHADTAILNHNGNLEIYFDYGELIVEYPNGKNITYTKPYPVDQGGNEETCNIACTGYSCSGKAIPSQGCSCGCTYCCFNYYTNQPYLCPSNSAACCHTGTSTYGCAVSVGCNICDW